MSHAPVPLPPLAPVPAPLVPQIGPVLLTYGVQFQPVPALLQGLQAGVLQTLMNRSQELLPCFASLQGAKRSTGFINLCRYLSNGINSAAERAATLITMNDVLGERNLVLNVAGYQAHATATQLAALSQNDKAFLRQFIQVRRLSLQTLMTMLAHAGIYKTNAAEAMCWTASCFATLDRAIQTTRCAGFRDETIAALAQAARLFPVHGGFTGFSMWGTGDALPEDENEAKLIARDDEATRQKNLRGHFMKHVLAIGKPGAEVVTEESAWWWQKLGISIQRSDLIKTPAGRLDEIRHMFAPSGVLMPGYVASFLELPCLVENASLVGRLVQRYENTYGILALTESRTMSKVAVFVANGKVMISGVGDDDLYIVGRVEANGIVGISSCYMANDIVAKLNGRNTVLLWEVTNDF